MDGFFDKLARCDVFVIYDDAQYVHGGYHNRNRIRTCKGWRWITIPIVHNHPQMIKDVRISGTRWRKDHTRIISQHYEKSPYFKTYFPLIEEALNFNHELLIGLNLHLLKNIAEALGLKAKMIRSSEFPYYGIDKNEKLISMCKFLGADTYLSGSGSRGYIDEKAFFNSNIKLQMHNYIHPTYQQHFEGFEPNMSIIDLLFNLGPQAKEAICSGGSIEEKNQQSTLVTEIRQITVEQQKTSLALRAT
jgi:hypothetical protein